MTATRVGDQPRGGWGRTGASRRPIPRWYTVRNQTRDQRARKFAAVTRSSPRTATAQSWYENAWTTYT